MELETRSELLVYVKHYAAYWDAMGRCSVRGSAKPHHWARILDPVLTGIAQACGTARSADEIRAIVTEHIDAARESCSEWAADDDKKDLRLRQFIRAIAPLEEISATELAARKRKTAELENELRQVVGVPNRPRVRY
jgi:hypothetical protein